MSALGEIRLVTSGSRGVLGMWWRGSLAMAGYACRCVGQGFALAWKTASTDSAVVQEKKDRIRAQRVKAAEKAEKSGKPSTLPDPAAPIELDPELGKRSFMAALGSVVLGGGLAVVAVGTAGSVLVPLIPDLTPWRPLIFGGGFLIWSAAALMLAPPPTPKNDHEGDFEEEQREDDDQEQPQDAEAATVDRGTALLLHVLTALSDAEFTKRAGVHLDVVLASAVTRELLPADTEVSALRTWVESCGLPVEPKLGMRIEGKPVTRVGLRVDAATTALGMTPTALLTARSEAGVRPTGEATVQAVRAPAQAVGETPDEAAAGTSAETPVPAPISTPATAVLRLIPGGLLDPAEAPSPALSQGQAPEAR
ncbi:hypothetical protein ACFWG6_28820 [Streptomyces erythrochromogenes]|uniref:hypothetical protein n=1 Tax=Streptomyces erythrochromogenes TaxID=285574 RepID=UPI0036361842